MSKIAGLIKGMPNNTIQTRFFFVNLEQKIAQDITLELCKVLSKDRREKMKKEAAGGNYETKVPYTYKNGIAEYSFGCGLSHYLSLELLKEIAVNYEFSINVSAVKNIEIFTPDDLRHILKIRSVFEEEIEKKLINYFCNR